MEVIQVAKLIEQKIHLLERGRQELQKRAEKKAETLAEYEKTLALRIIELKNGKEMLWQGETIKDPPATIMEKIARGLSYQEKLNAEQAEAEYKNAIVGLNCIESELNGYQSINRYLTET